MSVNSDPVYNREGSYEAYCPKVANDNFLNEAVEGNDTPVALVSSILATVLVPCNPAIDNIPILDPALDIESKATAGDGLSKGEVYDKGYTDGAGSKRSYCIFGHHIKDTLGSITASSITGNVAEITTVAHSVKASYTDADYFVFDGIDADGDNPVVKYYVWYDVTGGGADPTITGRTAIEADISGATTADDVGVITAALITALDDFTCTNSSGTITITNSTAGAVDNAWASNTSADTVTITTDGVTTKVLVDSGTTLPNIGLHIEKELSGEDLRDDYVGVTQLEYLFECEEGGVVEEERNYLVARPVTGSDLARPRGPDGNAWTSGQHPLTRYKKNFNWGDFTFTFQYGSPAADVEVKITSFKLKMEIETDYKRDNGAKYSNGRQVKARRVEISMTVRPTGKDIRDISRLHYKDYDGAPTGLTLTVKVQRGSDTNDYIQWAFTSLMLLPYDQFVPVDPYYEEVDITMEDAPGNTTTCTIKGYLSQQWYGVD